MTLSRLRLGYFSLTLITCIILAGKVPQALAISSSLSLSPAKYDLKVIEHQIQQSTITITNNSDVAIPIEAEVMDFAPKDAKGKVEYNVSMPGRSGKAWFHVKPENFLLEPHASRTVEVAITPPEIVPAGSYFSVVMFEASLPSNYFDSEEQTQAKIIPWIGTLYLLKVGEPPPLDDTSLTIKRFSYPQFTSQKEVPVTLEVVNNTNFHVTPEAEFKLNSYFGSTVARTETEDTTIMPGMSRIFEATIDQNRWLGLYKGVAAIKIAGYEKTVTGGPLYSITLLGIGLLLGSVLGLTYGFAHRQKYSRRFKAAWTALKTKTDG